MIHAGIMRKFSCTDCDDGIEYTLEKTQTGPLCRVCGAVLTAIPTPARDDNTTVGQADALQGIFDLFGAELQHEIIELLNQSAPTRQISLSYLKTLGRVTVDRRKVILRDISFHIGPLRVLAVSAGFGYLPENSFDVKGPVVFGEPYLGSELLSNKVDCQGSIVMLGRGGVSFATKSAFAIAAGAAAVVIVQTMDVWPFLMTDNTGEYEQKLAALSFDDTAPHVPVVMVGKSDAEVISKLVNGKSSARDGGSGTGTLIDACVRIGHWVRECSICQDEIAEGSTVLKLPCRHLYHCDCVVSWLEQNNTCPLCRLELPQTTHEEVQGRHGPRSQAFQNSLTSTYYN